MMSPRFATACSIWWINMALVAEWGPPGADPLGNLMLYLIGFGGMLAMAATFPPRIRPRRALLLILTLAVGARLLFAAYPVGNDVYRYVWEGAIQLHGYNPYTTPPDSPVLQHLAEGELAHVWPLINHRELPAAYPPLTLICFRMLAAVQPDPYLFKWALALVDLAVLVLLWRLLRDHRRPPAALLLYAANPLVILYISGEGHLDVLQVFWLLLGLRLFRHAKDGWGFAALGLGVVTKYLVLVALPFLITRRNVNKSWLVLPPLLLFLPYRDAGLSLFDSLQRFSLEMHYNDSIYAVMRLLGGHRAMVLNLAALGAVLGIVYLTAHSRDRRVYLAIASALLFLPTLHPWYLVLIAPFVALYPSAAWIYLQAAMAFTFPVVGREWSTGVFQEMLWIKGFIYIPFFGLLGWERVRGAGCLGRHRYPPVSSVSVVVPALDEADRIARCLASLRVQPLVREMIVVDGGSRDDTRLRAAELGATVVDGTKGRGGQIRQGIVHCRGEVVMVVHADCTLAPGTADAVVRRLNARPDAAGGAVRMQFAPSGPTLGMLAWLNNLRARLTGIAFGDQAQFFRADALAAAGGFPPVMLMEDVEVSLRMKAQGRLLFIPRGVTVSSRHWRGRMRPGRVWLVLKLCGIYLLARRLDRLDSDNAGFYKAYYGDGG